MTILKYIRELLLSAILAPLVLGLAMGCLLVMLALVFAPIYYLGVFLHSYFEIGLEGEAKLLILFLICSLSTLISGMILSFRDEVLRTR